ncbi:MAG: inositol monophosphatase [Candidatus Eremiobacteraeota bacterium]|nr:inositol monophosphatase [Candidatus Eremiobacteraeota bacterium]
MPADPLTVAIQVAQEAGALLMEFLHGPLQIREKARRADLVTDADRAAERLIFERLRADFPQSTFVGEEGGVHAGPSDERWYVDPLDGTTNFTHGYPMFCVSIGYERAGELVAGVIYAPVFKELYVAQKGAGATLNGEPIGVSDVSRVANALVCTGFHPADFARNGAHFGTMSGHAQGVRRDGSAALDLAAVGAGRFDGFWEFDLHAWDVAAGAVVITEAGGTVSAIDGSPFVVDAGSVLVSNGRIHEEMQAILKHS